MLPLVLRSGHRRGGAVHLVRLLRRVLQRVEACAVEAAQWSTEPIVLVHGGLGSASAESRHRLELQPRHWHHCLTLFLLFLGIDEWTRAVMRQKVVRLLEQLPAAAHCRVLRLVREVWGLLKLTAAAGHRNVICLESYSLLLHCAKVCSH